MRICFDCQFNSFNNPIGRLTYTDPSSGEWAHVEMPSPLPEDFLCPHWDPKYWESLGYRRNWGDAAVMAEGFEVLRRESVWSEGGHLKVEYVVLCPSLLRRPLEINAVGPPGMTSWGGY